MTFNATIQKIGKIWGYIRTHLESSRLLTPYNLVLWCKNHSIFIHHSKCYRSLESRLSQSFFWRGNDIGVVPFVSTHILFPLDTTMNHTAQKTISKMCRAAMKSWSWMMMKLGNLILPVRKLENKIVIYFWKINLICH